jgi:glycosyltransferase involved in cell wall biosynthesis
MNPKGQAAPGSGPRVAFVTNMPSYHQVDLFNALHRSERLPFRVFYLRRMSPGRQWTRAARQLLHPHTFVPELRLSPYVYLNPGLVSALRAFRPDLLVVTQYASLGMQLVMVGATLLGTPFVFWSEAGGVEFTEHLVVRNERLRRALREVALLPVRKGATEIWGIGGAGLSYYAARSEKPVRNLPYFVDLAPFSALRPPPFAGRLRLLFLGKLNVRKGVDVLVSGVEAALVDGMPIEVTLAGDGPLRAEVARLAARWPSQVRYLGFRELDEIPELLAWAHVLICPSRYDGWGMVVVEAMASGLPVIATPKVAAARDLVVAGENGWLMEPGSAMAITQALARALESGPRLADLSSRARHAARPYDAAVGAERLADYVERAWSGSRG